MWSMNMNNSGILRDHKLTSYSVNSKCYASGVDTPKEEVIFTYSVIFKEIPLKCAFRWDKYILMENDQIYYLSIINSVMVVYGGNDHNENLCNLKKYRWAYRWRHQLSNGEYELKWNEYKRGYWVANTCLSYVICKIAI